MAKIKFSEKLKRELVDATEADILKAESRHQIYGSKKRYLALRRQNRATKMVMKISADWKRKEEAQQAVG